MRTWFPCAKSYNQRRRLMVQSFRDMGLSCFEPLGAFYVFPGIQKDRHEQRGLLPAPPARKEGRHRARHGLRRQRRGYIRCSYATGIAKLTEALDRMADFVASL